jgi:hypothetical protein
MGMKPLTVRYTGSRYAMYVIWAVVWIGMPAIAFNLSAMFPPADPTARTVFWALIFPCLMVVCPIGAFYYSMRLHVENDQLTIYRWGVRPRTYRLSDIVTFKLRRTSRGTLRAILSFVDGHRLTVAGDVEHFEPFCDRFSALTEDATTPGQSIDPSVPIRIHHRLAFTISVAATIALLFAVPYWLRGVLTRQMFTLAPIASFVIALGGICVIGLPAIAAYTFSLDVELANGTLTVRRLGHRTASSAVTNLRQVVILSSHAAPAVGVEFPDRRQLLLRDPTKAVAALRDGLVAEYGRDRVQTTWPPA